GFVGSVAVRIELNVHIVADTALVDYIAVGTALVDYIAVGTALVDYIAVGTALDIAADSALTVDMGLVDHVAVGTALNVRIAALAAGSSLIYTVAALAVDIPALGFEGIAALCLSQYVSLSVGSGYCEISCPDGDCPAESGALTDKEIDSLINKEKVELLAKLRVNLEVERDPSRIWCPNAGCETICEIPQDASPLRPVDKWNNPIVHIQCKTCAHDFCSSCKESWHENSGCEEDPLNERQGLVKRCPFCKVPIERDSGCAQMMCRRCKHVFCWYCLVSLDEDFMLRHYDKGPCRDKLGHTKLSLLWHRLQVVAVFLGCGIFFIIVSPVVVLVAPCVYVSRRRKKKNKSGDSDENEEAKRSRYFF
ncbi:hypothetical protein QYM36_016874, partial [Artemia franciscana]